MGRRKPGKQRRPRPQHPAPPRQPLAPPDDEYLTPLQQLSPPGQHYTEWYDVERPRKDDLTDPAIPPQALALFNLLHRLAPTYQRSVPHAAILLDQIIDSGMVPFAASGDVTLMPVAELQGALFPTGEAQLTAQQIKESAHELHAAGAILIGDDGALHVVARPPRHPGDDWIFAGDEDAALVPSTCVPNGAAEALTPQQLGMLCLLRSLDSRGKKATPEYLVAQGHAKTPEEARELMETVTASGWRTEYGCEMCPSGHLCTRTGRNTK